MTQEKRFWMKLILAGVKVGMDYDKAKEIADQAIADLRVMDVHKETRTFTMPWHEAPDGYDWAAMDMNKKWHWYEGGKPQINQMGWWINNSQTFHVIQFTAPPFPGDWRDSLQRRPKGRQ